MSPLDKATFGDWGKLAIAKHFQKMLKHEAGVLKAEDPEELHQMRVGMRRLRSAIAGFSPALILPKAVTDKKIGKIARTLGKLRDLDVLADTFKNQYQPHLPAAEQKKLAEVWEILDKKRHQALSQVTKTLHHSTYQQLKTSLEAWIESPHYQNLGLVSIDFILADLLLPEISKLLLHPGWFVGVKVLEEQIIFPETLTKETIESILESEGEILHDLRKEAKRARYQLELFTQFYGEKYQAYGEDIKKIQTVLGEIQDCFILAEFLRKNLSSYWAENLPSLAVQLQIVRLEKYQQWQQLQEKFLNPDIRKDLHRTIEKLELDSVEEKPASEGADRNFPEGYTS